MNQDGASVASADQHGDRVERFTRGADLAPVAELLAERRDEILARWLKATLRQPFHRGRRRIAVADHIPHLIDGLVDLLRRTAPRDAEPEVALDDPRVLEAATRHAAVRFEQGLSADDIVTEFRLLRHEVGLALRTYLEERESAADVVAAELIVHDALDGAIALSLAALTEKVEEVRSDFLATSLHDAAQPIATAKLSIQLAARQLERAEPDLAKATDSLRRADHSLDRMTSLLRRLADASRLALGSLELRRVETGLGEIVQRALDELDPETVARVRLRVDDADRGEWDASAVEQVVANLIGNAVKFSPPGAPVEVEIHGATDDVELTVRDHGMGVPPQDAERIFQRFARSRTARDAGVEGQGLGLYLSRGIVEAHGGRIWVDPDGPRTGSVFHVLLPRHPRQPEAAEFES